MDKREFHKIHLIGIGGIGMSALAQLYQSRGVQVSGSDRSASPVTELLEQKGITVLLGQRAENVPVDASVVVYSDAVREGTDGYSERLKARELGIRERSYFEALGEATKGYRVVAVSGTHGKTTTTGMIAKILIDAGVSPTVVVGSIITDFGTNFVAGTSDIFVVEADEYMKHFLNFTPTVLVINNLEYDHTDFYPTFESMIEAFGQCAAQVVSGGAIVTTPSESAVAAALARPPQRSGISIVDYTGVSVPELTLIGEFNKSNARAAKAASRALLPTLTNEQIDASLSAFKGSWRRFEYKGTTKSGALVYDDYAHHPTAVAATLKAVRERFPQKRIIAAFHPHLYSRTRDLMSEFGTAFTDADIVFIAPIFAAREIDDGTVSSEMLAALVTKNGVHAEASPSLTALEAELMKQAESNDIIITMGAGDIYTVAEKLTN